MRRIGLVGYATAAAWAAAEAPNRASAATEAIRRFEYANMVTPQAGETFISCYRRMRPTLPVICTRVPNGFDRR